MAETCLPCFTADALVKWMRSVGFLSTSSLYCADAGNWLEIVRRWALTVPAGNWLEPRPGPNTWYTVYIAPDCEICGRHRMFVLVRTDGHIQAYLTNTQGGVMSLVVVSSMQQAKELWQSIQCRA